MRPRSFSPTSSNDVAAIAASRRCVATSSAKSRFRRALGYSTWGAEPASRRPDRAIEEAFRVLRPDGCLAVFDGDYATTTVAIADHDPLQACVDAMMANSVTDRRIMRRLANVVAAYGFGIVSFRSFGFAETSDEGYMLTVVDRGADVLCSQGCIGADTASALKEEARRRSQAGCFFGHIAYAGLIARKPDLRHDR